MGSNLSGGALVRGTAWNLGSLVLPLAVGLAVVPHLLASLGAERFGVLSLAWALIGYFGVLDLGLGTAVVKLTADRLGRSDRLAASRLATTALIAATLLGIVTGAALVLSAQWLVRDALALPEPLQADAAEVFVLLALSLPAVLPGTALQGVLAAHERFDLNALVRLPLGIWSFLGPLLAVLAGGGIVLATATLVAARWLALVAIYVQCLRQGVLAVPLRPRWSVARELFAFGRWVAVSNVVGPVMVNLDRFIITGVLSVGVVAYYTVPFDLLSRALVLPQALVGALFPALALLLVREPRLAQGLLASASAALLAAAFATSAAVVLLARPGLALWIGEDFGRESHRVLEILAIGFLWNMVAHASYVAVQAADRPAWTALLHLVELPLYLVALFWLLDRLGLAGAAVAWSARAALDGAALLAMCARRYPATAARLRRIALGSLLASVALGLAIGSASVEQRIAVLGAAMLLIAWLAWTLLDGDHRIALEGLALRVRKRLQRSRV